MTFSTWMQQVQAETEIALAACLPSITVAPQRLHAAMRYAVLDGGKRVRPLLVFAAGALGQVPNAILAKIGASVELIHAYSLVHDDLPCMDNDVLRRGKATCHIQFDETTALLAGDTLQTQAFELLSSENLLPNPQQQLRMIAILAHASGARGMGGGQAIDCANVGYALSQAELETMHAMKTGALIRAAVLLGALAAEVSETEYQALDQYAQQIGLAFQVVDDVLDAESDSATLGKTAGKDAADNKPTYVSLMGIDAAKALVTELLNNAQTLLLPFGERAKRLNEIAHFIVNRSF